MAFPFDGPELDQDGISSDNDFYSNPANFFNAIGRPPPKMASEAEVRDEAKTRGTSVFRNYEFLNQILQRHEPTIRKRWTKKTRQQRIKVLLGAWPNMPTGHRPDFEAHRRAGLQGHNGSKPLVNKSLVGSYMWPYINQEDLSQPQPLLLLLNARGRELPCNFAAADLDAMHLGIVSEVIERIFLNEFTLMLHGMTTAEEYGKLLSWDDHPDAFDWMHSQKQFNPSDGLVVLEAQDKLMEFLVKCCLDILHEIPQGQLTSPQYPIQPEPLFKTEREISGFNSLAVMAAEAPYRIPARLDLQLVETLLAAKTRAAEDHMWALREDPGYFHQNLIEMKEHRQELIMDGQGRSHPTLTHGRERLFWARVIGNLLVDAYIDIEVFSELHEQVQDLINLQEKYRSSISPMEDLPEEYLSALLKFQHFLNQAAKGPLGQLKQAVVASPPLRRLYVREPPPNDTSPMITIVSKGSRQTRVESQLLYLLQTLWEDDQQLFLHGLPPVVDELERLLQAEPEAAGLLSSRVANIISSLSIISQCIHQIEIYHPWAQNFESAAAGVHEELQEQFTAKGRVWARILTAFTDQNLTYVAKLGEPLPGKFTYPVAKRRTQENVDKMRRAEHDLDAFWAATDRLLHAKAGDLNGTTLQKLLSRDRTLQRTPEWVEPAEPKKAASLSQVEQPLSDYYFTTFQEQSQDRTPERPKVKVKAWGIPSQQEAPDTAVAAPTTEARKAEPLFKVDNRALKVFRTLFYDPAVTSTPGEIPWNDFVHAIASVGFAAQKLYGSVWQFSPTKLDVEASIHFHEPHPRGKLPFTVARRYGRRLNRSYGWSGNMFILGK